MISAIGLVKIAPNLWPTRSSGSAREICENSALTRHSSPSGCTPGHRFLIGFFAFTARYVQSTTATDPNERGKVLHDPKLSAERSQCDPQALLRNRLSRNADRSGLRRSTTVRGFSDHLLH